VLKFFFFYDSRIRKNKAEGAKNNQRIKIAFY
jgi:hypothetical protein